MDKSKFNIFGSNGQTYVWLSPIQNCKIKILNRQSNTDGSVMVWTCMSSCRVGNLQFIWEYNEQRYVYRHYKSQLTAKCRKTGHEGSILCSAIITTRNIKRVFFSPGLFWTVSAWCNRQDNHLILMQLNIYGQFSKRPPNDLIAALKEERAKITA